MTRTIITLAVLAALTVTACTPAQQEAWKAMSAQERENYVAHIEGRPPYETADMGESVDCYQALDRHWPAATRQWARDIVWRESRNTPTAANPRSTARGCGQLLLSLHGWRFTAVGCSPAQWADPDCNVKAMLHLYREAGTSPWSL